MADENLTGALRASLSVIEGSATGTSDGMVGPEQSPLSEVTPEAIDQLLDEMNLALVEGMPERITDEKLIKMVDIYRAQAYEWAQKEQQKKTKAPRGTKKEKEIDLSTAVDVGDLLDP